MDNTIDPMDENVTMELVYKTIKANHNDILTKITSIMETQNPIITRLDNVERSTDEINADHSVLKDEVNNLQEKMQNDVHEEIRRLHKLHNLVIMDLPETDDGINLARKIIEILLPQSHTQIDIVKNRIRKSDPLSDPSKPRPLEINLNNPTQSKTALSNCKKLAGYEEF